MNHSQAVCQEEDCERLKLENLALKHKLAAARQKMRQLAKKSTTDGLTKIPNRVAYNAAKRREAARQRRSGQSLVVAAFDIDRFKRINDEYGHQAGDQVLKRFAKLLVAQLRETDFVARYGGEEFVAIMPNTTIETAQYAIDRLRELVADTSVRAFGKTIRFTVSIGIATQSVDENPGSIQES